MNKDSSILILLAINEVKHYQKGATFFNSATINLILREYVQGNYSSCLDQLISLLSRMQAQKVNLNQKQNDLLSELKAAKGLSELGSAGLIKLAIGLLENAEINVAEIDLMQPLMLACAEKNYGDCVYFLQDICKSPTLKNEEILKFKINKIVSVVNLNQHLSVPIKLFSLYDNPAKNYSRRFFEHQLVMHMITDVSAAQLQNLRELSDFLHEKYYIPTSLTATSWDYVGKTFDNIRDFTERRLEVYLSSENFESATEFFNEYLQFARNLRDFTNFLQVKDRGTKSIECIYSYHPGILKYEQYVPRDMYCKVTGVSLADNYKLRSLPGFSQIHQHMPFVNSQSGTLLDLIVILCMYVNECQQKHTKFSQEKLQKTVNVIIKLYVLHACSNGYHSLMEVCSILELPKIKNIFAQYNLEVEISFPSYIVEKAWQETTTYCQRLMTLSNVHEEIQQHPKRLRNVHEITSTFKFGSV